MAQGLTKGDVKRFERQCRGVKVLQGEVLFADTAGETPIVGILREGEEWVPPHPTAEVTVVGLESSTYEA